MPHHKTHPVSDEVYEGANKATVALGKAKIYGLIGGLTTGVGFATLAAMSPSFTENVVKGADTIKGWSKKLKGLVMSEKTAARTDLGVIAGVGITGWIVGHWVFTAIGFGKALPKAHRGEEQFEKVKEERNAAEAELGALKEQISDLGKPSTKHSETVKSRKDSHAETVDSKKEHATEIAR